MVLCPCKCRSVCSTKSYLCELPTNIDSLTFAPIRTVTPKVCRHFLMGNIILDYVTKLFVVLR